MGGGVVGIVGEVVSAQHPVGDVEHECHGRDDQRHGLAAGVDAEGEDAAAVGVVQRPGGDEEQGDGVVVGREGEVVGGEHE